MRNAIPEMVFPFLIVVSLGIVLAAGMALGGWLSRRRAGGRSSRAVGQAVRRDSERERAARITEIGAETETLTCNVTESEQSLQLRSVVNPLANRSLVAAAVAPEPAVATPGATKAVPC